jgi:hypothetical protein
MTHDSTQVAAAARHARAKAIGQGISQCLVALCAGLMAALRTRPLFHEERRPPGRERRQR